MPRNSTKPKKKLKTHRGARKRFKITANGKILRIHSGKRHLLGTKPARRMRKLKKLTKVNRTIFAGQRGALPALWLPQNCGIASSAKRARQRFTGACRPFAPREHSRCFL